MKTHIIYISLLSTLVVAWIFLGPAQTKGVAIVTDSTVNTLPERHEGREESFGFGEGRLLELAAQVQRLEQERNQLLATIDALEQALTDQQVSAVDQNQQIQDEAVMAASDEARNRAANAALNMINVTNIDERLADEPVDPEWAYAMETDIRDILVTTNELSNLFINDIQCRTRICVVDFGVYDSNEGFDTLKFHRATQAQEIIDLSGYSQVTMLNSNDGTAKWILQRNVGG